jgi:hypothetical protein
MTTRLRTIGIRAAIAALLASGALLFASAPPAEARPSQGSCDMIEDSIELALDFGDIGRAWELMERYFALGC